MSDPLAGGFARPRWAHVPGSTYGADEAPLEAAKATVPARFDGPPDADAPALRYGLALCDHGFFWESHEVLEAVWMATAPNSRDRHALRAAIQIANAGLKLRMARPRAALRLLAEVRHVLAEIGLGEGRSFADRLDVARLDADIAALREALASGVTKAVVPRLGLYVRDMQETSH